MPLEQDLNTDMVWGWWKAERYPLLRNKVKGIVDSSDLLVLDATLRTLDSMEGSLTLYLLQKWDYKFIHTVVSLYMEEQKVWCSKGSS